MLTICFTLKKSSHLKYLIIVSKLYKFEFQHTPSENYNVMQKYRHLTILTLTFTRFQTFAMNDRFMDSQH
jgi:hypothetical protein